MKQRIAKSNQMNSLKNIHTEYIKTFDNQEIPKISMKLGKRKREDYLIHGDIDHYEGESKTQVILKSPDGFIHGNADNVCHYNALFKEHPLSLSESSEYSAQSQNIKESTYLRFKKRPKHCRGTFQEKDESIALKGRLDSRKFSFGLLPNQYFRKDIQGSTDEMYKAEYSHGLNHVRTPYLNHDAATFFDGSSFTFKPNSSLREYDGEEEIEDEEDYVYEEDLDSAWSELNNQSEHVYQQQKPSLETEYSSANSTDNERLCNPDFFHKLVIVDKNENDDKSNILYSSKSLPVTSGELRLRRDLEDLKDLQHLAVKYDLDIDRIIIISPSKLEIHLKSHLPKSPTETLSTLSTRINKNTSMQRYKPSTFDNNALTVNDNRKDKNSSVLEADLNFPLSYYIEIGSTYPHEAPRVSIMDKEGRFCGKYPFINNEGRVVHPLITNAWTGVCTMLTIVEVLSFLKQGSREFRSSNTHDFREATKSCMSRHYDYMTDSYVLESELECDQLELKLDNITSSSTASQVPSTCSTIDSFSTSSSLFLPTSLVHRNYDNARIEVPGVPAAGTQITTYPMYHSSTNPQTHIINNSSSCKNRNHLSFKELMQKADSHIRENNLIMNDFRQRHRDSNESVSTRQFNETRLHNEPTHDLPNIRYRETERQLRQEVETVKENIQDGHNSKLNI